MKKITVNIDKKFRTMTARQFCAMMSYPPLCQKAVSWMKKIGMNHTMEFFFNRCSRYGWIMYAISRASINSSQYFRMCNLLRDRFGCTSDPCGYIISKKRADVLRSSIEINWI